MQRLDWLSLGAICDEAWWPEQQHQHRQYGSHDIKLLGYFLYWLIIWLILVDSDLCLTVKIKLVVLKCNNAFLWKSKLTMIQTNLHCLVRSSQERSRVTYLCTLLNELRCCDVKKKKKMQAEIFYLWLNMLFSGSIYCFSSPLSLGSKLHTIDLRIFWLAITV